jgi:heme exporter protein A
VLSLDNITLERFFEPVFKPVSAQLNPGEILMVTGANGCGKTTLIRIIAGLLDASDGSMSLPDHSIAYVGHYLGLKDTLTVRENLQFYSRFYATNTEYDIDASLERMQILPHADQPARSLSAGQRKRCALARLLFQPEALWLLDEPYANLDENGLELVDSLLREHQATGGMAVVVSHNRMIPDDLQSRNLNVLAWSDAR